MSSLVGAQALVIHRHEALEDVKFATESPIKFKFKGLGYMSVTICAKHWEICCNWAFACLDAGGTIAM